MRPKPRAHAGERQADGMERRRQVHRERLVPALHGEVLDRREMAHHGIVHQDVHAAPGARGLGHHVADAVRLGEIGADVARGGGAARLEPRHRFRHPGLRHDAVDDHVAALGGEPLGDREAEPAGRAGEEGAPAAQPRRHVVRLGGHEERPGMRARGAMMTVIAASGIRHIPSLQHTIILYYHNI